MQIKVKTPGYVMNYFSRQARMAKSVKALAPAKSCSTPVKPAAHCVVKLYTEISLKVLDGGMVKPKKVKTFFGHCFFFCQCTWFRTLIQKSLYFSAFAVRQNT